MNKIWCFDVGHAKDLVEMLEKSPLTKEKQARCTGIINDRVSSADSCELRVHGAPQKVVYMQMF